MKTIYSVTYRVNCKEINSLGLFNSIDDAKVVIALHERGGSFYVYSAGEVEELVSEINYQLAIIYDDEEGDRFFYSEDGDEYRVHEWEVDDDFTIESDMFEVIHLEVLPCDEIQESIGLTPNRSYCSDIILGCEERRRADNGDDLTEEDKINLVSEIDSVIVANDQILFDDGDVCYCIVTHKFFNEK